MRLHLVNQLAQELQTLIVMSMIQIQETLIALCIHRCQHLALAPGYSRTISISFFCLQRPHMVAGATQMTNNV